MFVLVEDDKLGDPGIDDNLTTCIKFFNSCNE